MPHQLSIAEALLWRNPNKKRTKTAATLSTISTLIDWNPLVALLHGLYKSNQHTGGRPPIDLEKKIKMLFLQHLYNMSDEQIEEQLMDNRRFMEFLSLRPCDDLPDYTLHWRFKERLGNKTLQKNYPQKINHRPADAFVKGS